ncbi:hypothetical protein [Streptomyces sp. NPDC059071]|uniref:hypothetical protein n=1 Tax=unclassified Streptomyces TaxID=2593676 RepID=UPI003627B15D
MSPRFWLAVRLYAAPVLGTFALALHHKLTTGSWTFPVLFTVPTLALASFAFWHNRSPEARARLEFRRAAKRNL